MRMLDTLEEYTSTKQQEEEEKHWARVGFIFPTFVSVLFTFSMLPC
jgi:hypothetical protein